KALNIYLRNRGGSIDRPARGGIMQFARALAASMLCAVTASGAAAQTYPNRPVTLVVAFAPGGADDATARILQDPMQKALGQPIVVENVSGAGGMIGAAKVARAERTVALDERPRPDNSDWTSRRRLVRSPGRSADLSGARHQSHASAVSRR